MAQTKLRAGMPFPGCQFYINLMCVLHSLTRYRNGLHLGVVSHVLQGTGYKSTQF